MEAGIPHRVQRLVEFFGTTPRNDVLTAALERADHVRVPISNRPRATCWRRSWLFAPWERASRALD